MQEIDLYGPPGTGKTTRLNRLAMAAVAEHGPQRVGAVTYTRAAATELKGRIAASLGIRVPESPRAARETLEREIPYVGTVHSLCYRSLGRPPTLTGAELTQFCRTLSPDAGEVRIPSPDEVEGFEMTDIAGQDEVVLALQLYAQARHRMISVREAAGFLGYQASVRLVPDRAEFIVQKYEEYKRDLKKIDFEDMLILGREFPLPVTVLLCDEVQDNSALLWSVINAWAQNTQLVVMAGDPWQAIYQYMGAEPSLFRNRAGRWATIGDSHRLSASTADYALSLLKNAGYLHDSLLTTWSGIGGQPKDGTRFYLARTNALLRGIRDRLEQEGTPYRLLRGTGPLQMKAAQAYRQYRKDGLTNLTAHLFAEAMPPGTMPYGMKADLKRAAEASPDLVLGSMGHAFWRANIDRVPNFNYYERVVERHGMAGLILTPPTQVGTIHAAKGREADEVYLLRLWGRLPGMSLYGSPEGRQGEACVAYVGTTRHRSRLVLLDSYDGGIPYPFPALPLQD